jgi:hypothetical protein
MVSFHLLDLDRVTFQTFKLLLSIPETGILPMPSFDVFVEKETSEPWFAQLVDEVGY